MQCIIPAWLIVADSYMNELNKNTCRLGILGSAAIVSRAVLDVISHIPQVEVVAIANRTRSKALHLAQRYSIPHVLHSLEEVLEHPHVDAVYIALSNDLHMEWVLRALEAGKHVLVEKPAGLGKEDAQQLASALKQSPSLIFMEGIITAHHPWQAALKAIVNSGQYGLLNRTETRISIPAPKSHRDNYRSVKLKGGGCFNDLGCYWLQWIQHLVGLEGSRVSAFSNFDGPDGCDWTFNAKLRYGNGFEANVLTSFELPYKAMHTLYFERATVVVPNFFRPLTGFYSLKIRLNDSNPQTYLKQFEPMNYYVNQLQAFANRCLHPDDRQAEGHLSVERMICHQTIMEYAQQHATMNRETGNEGSHF
ncbi:Gfo/Idh/MocA family oxidoreductase [Paenibacillus amylolyticus]|uniref:Gfo/Idh/MocA family oxidoreductase n=2 Tax=Paenibacillus amylolyticus TaxID=1451 RepID=A0A5M9X0G8_PAEAM|nr:Gfo/Idh/MocA family oxidoreductase [Paenibacillus amylolyticus]